MCQLACFEIRLKIVPLIHLRFVSYAGLIEDAFMSKKESDQSGKSSAPDQKKVVQNEVSPPAAVKSQKVGGGYKAAELYDFDRYFLRPGTAE